MLLSPRKNGLTSLFKEVRVFKVCNVFRPNVIGKSFLHFKTRSLGLLALDYSEKPRNPSDRGGGRNDTKRRMRMVVLFFGDRQAEHGFGEHSFEHRAQ